MANELVMIAVSEIYQHPDNPRKDLGDLSELTESIKKKGVMQNLTVIPGHFEDGEWKDDCYTLIIGHRRCAAAKAAGLEEVPCRIVEQMDKKDQVSTMLEENMQRNDLTVFEQAQGFQMMLDLGETADTISEKTGFSKKTVKHRLNLAKLDQEELKKKTDEDGSFQLTLKDLYELEKIADVKTRDEILKSASDSRDLVWKAKRAAEKEKEDAVVAAIVNMAEELGIKPASDDYAKHRWDEKYKVVKEISLDEIPKELNLGKKLEGVMYYKDYNKMKFIKLAEKKEKKLSEYEIKQKEKEKAKKELKQKCKAMFDAVDSFIKEVVNGGIQPIKEDTELYKELISTVMTAGTTFYASDLEMFHSGKGLYDIKKDEEANKEFEEWRGKLSPLHKAIVHMSCIRKVEIYNYNVEYSEEAAEKINAVIDFLAKYGFSVSDEEKEILDGTHELYQKRG